MKDPNDTATREIMPKKTGGRGGWREGGGRPKSPHTTKLIRADLRLISVFEALKIKLKSGAMNEEDLKAFEELVMT